MLNLLKYNNFLITIGVMVSLVNNLQAQNGSGYFNQAENLFKTKNYYEASVVFEKYLATEKHSRPRSTPFAIEKKVKGKTNLDPHQEAVYQLATSYRMVNNYQKAEKYYKESIKFSEKAYPDARYWYAVTLRANQQFAEARLQIDSFLMIHTQMDELLLAAGREQEDLKFIAMQSERVNDLFTLEAIKGKDSASSYALVQRADGFVYTKIKEVSEKNGPKRYMNTLVESMNSENPLMNADTLQIPTSPQIHDGMATFSHDGKKMFFTRWTKNNDQTVSYIYVSRWENNKWTIPVKAPEPLNIEGSNSAQPSLTTDGRYLLFSSDREGGFGGYDIWSTSLDSNFEPIQVRNLGNIINSAGDEEAPFLHDKSRTLVFSSNGRIGMGGFDIYYAKGSFGMNDWEKPVNAGAPLNSPKDDIYFISTDEDDIWNTGWMSSDRSSECCLALFSVKGNNAKFLNGMITDCKTHKTIANTELVITDLRHPDRILGKYKTDSVGRYSFTLHNSAHFKISLAHPDYDPASEDFNLQIHPGTDTVMNDTICMEPVGFPKEEVDRLLKTLEQSSHIGNFAYKKAVLNDYSRENLDSLAKIMNNYTDLVIRIEGYSDGIGGVKYNLKLSQKRVDVCIKYLISKGVRQNQLQGKAMGKCCPIAPETIHGKDNPAGREKNRRVEYKILNHP
jgi:outer membrane protein OmpA-like peptidoglycan-associated protein/tetratricopeptide (TPR) repeat protein